MTTTNRPAKGRAPASPDLLAVSDLRVAFRMRKAAPVEAVRGVSFAIPPRSTVALVGESGSGKSVSAMAIVRLLPDNAEVDAASRIDYDGVNLLQAPAQRLRQLRGREISVVFQDPLSSLNPVFTVGDQVAEALRLHASLSRRQAQARAEELLAEVGIPHPRERMRAFPHELSGGQQQRVMIAAAIACEPKLLIADEPTTALDVTVQRQIVELMQRLREKRAMSMLFISHDLALVGEIADRVVVLRDGRVREAGPAADLFAAPRDPYTRALLACRPRVDVRLRRLPVVEQFLAAGPDAPVPQAAAPAPAAERTSAAGPPLVEVRGLRKEFRLKTGLLSHRRVEAVRDASFTIARRRTLGVVGESGSGKTTVGLMLMRLVEPTAGEIRFGGEDLLSMPADRLMDYRRRVQIIFQNPYASLNPRFRVDQILVEPMRIHRIGADDAARRDAAADLLERVGMPRASLSKYPHEFSGGQRQRIAIARCLALRPELLVCDESVSALDVSVQATVINLLLDLQEELGISYLFISHDLAAIRSVADEILVMNRGEIVERGSADAIFGAPAHEYTRRLLSSVPRGISGANGRRIV
ncbi:MAG TPA: ABC transporter ATP-binding protein [Burkholderiaceae bacterium]|nr:ABC transporter ATP-binding protein [Burkholderiaceae bacterium]